MESETKRIKVRGGDSWPESPRVTFAYKPYPIGTKVWLVYANSNYKDEYTYYMGAVYVAGIEKEVRLLLPPGLTFSSQYKYVYKYKLVTKNNKDVPYQHAWMPGSVVFATKQEAIKHAQDAVHEQLLKDRRYHEQAALAADRALMRLQDDSIALEFNMLEAGDE